MKAGTKSGFWAGGRKTFLDQIRAEEAEAIAELKETLAAESDQERRKAIRADIKKVQVLFRQRIKDVRESLFGLS
jgi:hypothetical protein